MNLAVVAISSDEQIHVKVLHTLVQLNAVVNNSLITCNIQFCNNDPVSKATMFKTVLNGNYDKTIWIELDTYVPVSDIAKILNEHKNEDFIVFPGMESIVDWEQFADFTTNETENMEPLNMRGIKPDLKFNYNPKNDVPGPLIPIQHSDLRVFIMSNKKVQRKLKNKFKNTKYHFTAKEHNGNFLGASENLCRMLKESGSNLKLSSIPKLHDILNTNISVVSWIR